MKRFQVLGLTGVVLLLMATVSASSALAGPLWLGPLVICKPETTTNINWFPTQADCFGDTNRGTGVPTWRRLFDPAISRLQPAQVLLQLLRIRAGTITKLIGEGTTIECSEAHSIGTILGGDPGRDHKKITFTGCKVEGKTEAECHVNSQGETGNKIVVNLLSELVYIGTKTQAEKEEGGVGDLVVPAEGGTTFVTLNLEGTKCQTSGLVKLKGSTVAEIPLESGKTALWVNVKFPNPPINKAFVWESAGKVKEVKPSLKAFGVSNNVFVGEFEGMLTEEEGLEFGVSDT